MTDGLIFYDADCGLGECLLARLLRWDRAGGLLPLALHRPRAAARAVVQAHRARCSKSSTPDALSRGLDHPVSLRETAAPRPRPRV